MKGIHLGSYWMGKNDVVYTIADDFEHYFGVKKIDLGIYAKDDQGKIYAVEENECFRTVDDKGNKVTRGLNFNYLTYLFKRIFNAVKNRIKKFLNFILCFFGDRTLNYASPAPRREIKSSYLKSLLDEHNPDFIVLNSAGLHFSEKDFLWLKKKGVVTVCFTLSDPDVFDSNGKYYADKFDLCFTNSKLSLQTQYSKLKNKNVFLLPFATSDRCHYPEENGVKEFDVVVVGHARKDRLPIVKELRKHFKVGLYGGGWKNGEGTVNGEAQRQAINKGKVYLSFAKTMAGYTNVKVGLFEAMACRTVVVTDYMDEVFDYFRSGSEILVYENTHELIQAIKLVLEDSKRQEWISKNSYERFIREHTWKSRLNFVLEKIKDVKK